MYRKIPTYKAEAEAGLSDAINAKENRSILAYCPILLDKNVDVTIQEKTRSKNPSSFEQSTALNQDQFDLQYIYSILATTGWNRNDDVFDKYEMWSARNTAEDKPFNKSHDPKTIIGHITGNVVVDENYELVNENSEIDILPEKFHILTSAVLYKHISSRDEKLTLDTKSLIEEIAEGKWFVSMEALFSNFDYALVNAEGKEQIVSRNEDTSFLSKHLRSYGGEGEYDGQRIGRVMRNLTFSGKGLVENPGNPESIIFKEEDSVIFKGLAQTSPYVNLLVTSSSKGESSMSDNNEQVRTLEAQVSKLEARLRDMDEKKVQSQISELEKSCADKDAEIAELTSKIAEASEASADSEKSLEELSNAKAESDKLVAELKEKLETIAAESLRTSRISVLVDKGVDKSEADSLVETFSGITDEQFDALVTKFSEAPFHYKDKDKDEKKKKDEDEAKSDNMKKKNAEKDEANAEADEAAQAADEADDAESLETAEAEEAPALAAQSENDSDSVVASLTDYFGEVLGGNDNKEAS